MIYINAYIDSKYIARDFSLKEFIAMRAICGVCFLWKYSTRHKIIIFNTHKSCCFFVNNKLKVV